MIKVLFIFVSLLLVYPAQAQDKDDSDKYAVCKLLPKHTPENSVAYQPGVDVYGNPVTPADLNAAPMGDVLNVVKVPLDVNLAQNVVALSGTGLQLEAPLGMLDVYQDGRILYNGQDWTAPVLALCGRSHKKVTVDVIEVPVAAPEPEPTPQMVEPEPPAAPEVEPLPNKLVVETPADTLVMPSVTVPEVKLVDEVTPTKERMKNMDRPKISEPASPKQPLIGIPKGKSTTTSDVIKGQDHRDYNE